MAVAILAGSMAGFLLLGALVPRGAALVTGQLALVALPIALAVMHREPRLLGLRLPRATPVIAAVLIGCSLWYVNLRAVTWLFEHDLLPTSGDKERLDQLVDRGSLATALVTLALLPPLCEELVFRGVFARGLATRMPAILAIAISAVAFSAYHFSVLQAVPTFVLGLALATLAVRADSIVPAIVAHALNNGIAVLVTRDALPPVTAWIDRNPTAMLVGCASCAAAGVALAVVAEIR